MCDALGERLQVAMLEAQLKSSRSGSWRLAGWRCRPLARCAAWDWALV